MILEIVLFLLAVWICSSFMTSIAIRAERERIAQSLTYLQECSRKRRIDSLYGRDEDND